MSKSYFVLIFILLAIITGICVFAYSKSLPPKKNLPSTTQTQSKEATQAATPHTKPDNTVPLVIKTPKDGAEVSSSFISVEGVTAPNADVSVNNKDLLADADGKFKTTLILELGENPLIVFSSDEKGNSGTWEAVVTYDSTPVALTTTNSASESVTNSEATFSALVAPLPLAKVKGILESTASGELVMKVEKNLYHITLGTATHLVKRYGGKLLATDFKIGEELYVVGRFQNEEKTTITAQVVRNLSNKTRLTHFLTAVTQIIPPRSFKLATEQIVTIPSGAVLTNRLGEALTLDHFRSGDTIKVWGLFDPDTKRVTGISALTNSTLPLLGITTDLEMGGSSNETSGSTPSSAVTPDPLPL